MDAPFHPDIGFLAQRRREGFFATLTKRRLKRGVFQRTSVADLQAAINRFLEEHNQQSKAFNSWTANPDEQSSKAAVRRGHLALDSIH